VLKLNNIVNSTISFNMFYDQFYTRVRGESAGVAKTPPISHPKSLPPCDSPLLHRCITHQLRGVRGVGLGAGRAPGSPGDADPPRRGGRDPPAAGGGAAGPARAQRGVRQAPHAGGDGGGGALRVGYGGASQKAARVVRVWSSEVTCSCAAMVCHGGSQLPRCVQAATATGSWARAPPTATTPRRGSWPHSSREDPI
jgi:hypothetical protein